MLEPAQYSLIKGAAASYRQAQLPESLKTTKISFQILSNVRQNVWLSWAAGQGIFNYLNSPSKWIRNTGWGKKCFISCGKSVRAQWTPALWVCLDTRHHGGTDQCFSVNNLETTNWSSGILNVTTGKPPC